MISIYGGDSPNVIKALIGMEELGIAYRREPLDIMAGEQFSPEFLAISPNNRIPAIVDDDPADGGEPLSVFESGAILLYLAEKGGALVPASVRARSAAHAWLMWQMSGQGPMLGQAGHFLNYAPERLPYAIARFSREVARLYRVLDTALAHRDFLAGEYSVADIACWPWLLFRAHHVTALSDYPNVARWFAAIGARPAVRRVMADITVDPPQDFDEETRRILFNTGGR
ncbi:glutathione S-transferase N-terminal domain-containing protein [Croceicoccus mobilis]|nr:glutathione S-transferase N-terminal domain-containing protein [Croceicoccus mobilis]